MMLEIIDQRVADISSWVRHVKVLLHRSTKIIRQPYYVEII